MAKEALNRHQTSIRVLCEAFGISQTCYRYENKLSEENKLIIDWLQRLTQDHPRWGFLLCFLYLRNVKGFAWNHKRVYRIYQELELHLRIKPRQRIKREKPVTLQVPKGINQVWSMDFMSDSLTDGRTLRTFNVLDDYNREALGIEVDLSLPAARVVRSLERIIEWRGKPLSIRCDNGPEYLSRTLRAWCSAQRIDLLYIQPGKPAQNAYIERFNRTARHEWLDMHGFSTVSEAQQIATQWLWVYNNERPNMAIGGVPPRSLLIAA